MDEWAPTADAWLDLGQAAALVALSKPHLARLIADGAIPTRAAQSGRLGVMKGELLAWRSRDRAERRRTLVAWAAEIDREVFG